MDNMNNGTLPYVFGLLLWTAIAMLAFVVLGASSFYITVAIFGIVGSFAIWWKYCLKGMLVCKRIERTLNHHKLLASLMIIGLMRDGAAEEFLRSIGDEVSDDHEENFNSANEQLMEYFNSIDEQLAELDKAKEALAQNTEILKAGFLFKGLFE